MAGGDVKIIGRWASPFVMRMRIALNMKSVGYDFLQEEFGKKSELLLKSNHVYKKVPVMLHDDKPISESLIIVQYIDDVWTSGPKIVPSDPYDAAIARFWATYIDDKWYPSLAGIVRATNEEEKEKQIEGVFTGLALLEEAFEKCSKGKGFFDGDQIRYLDIALGCHIGLLKAIQKMMGVTFLDAEKTPGLLGWVDRFCAEDAVKEVIPETDKLVEFVKVLRARFSAL